MASDYSKQNPAQAKGGQPSPQQEELIFGKFNNLLDLLEALGKQAQGRPDREFPEAKTAIEKYAEIAEGLLVSRQEGSPKSGGTGSSASGQAQQGQANQTGS